MINIIVLSLKYLTSFVFKSFLTGFLLRVKGEVGVQSGLGDGFRVRDSVWAREGLDLSITANMT